MAASSEYCTKPEAAMTYIIIILCMLFIMQMLAALVRFITHFSTTRHNKGQFREEGQKSRVIFVSGVIFIILSIISQIGRGFGGSTGTYTSRCLHLTVSTELSLWFLFGFAYPMQWWLLIGTLFHRVYTVFHETAFELSPWTVRIYASILVITAIYFPILSVFGITLLSDPYNPVWTINVAISMLIATTTSISMSIVFVQRLIAVYALHNESQNAANDKLLMVITRSAVLMTVSTITAIFPLLVVVIELVAAPEDRSSPQASPYRFMLNLTVLIDSYTNFLCIVLSYQSFKPVYVRMCGCFDRKAKEEFLRWNSVRSTTAGNEDEMRGKTSTAP